MTLYAVWTRYRAAGDTVAPVLSYDFDADTGSTVADSSGNGNAGTWSGSPASTPGVSGKATYVNSPAGSKGGVNFFSLPLIPGKTDAASSFSYVFWLNEASSSSDSPIVSNQNFTHCYNPGTTLYNTDASGGILRACFGQNGTSTTQNYLPNASPASVIGAWHQVAVVADRSAGTMTAYLDGQRTVQSTALTSAFTLNSGFPFRVGAEGSGADTGDGFVNAAIDDFDFYAAPISAAQVQNDYLATRPSMVPTNTGSTVPAGFVSDTFRAPQVQAGATVSQRLAGLWNGGAVTSYTKVSGDAWLSVSADGTVIGTAPATAPADPAAITVQATDGTATSPITVEVTVIGSHSAPQLATATWNLWDAGTHVDDSVLKDLAVIAANGLDEIGLQQDGGTVATALAQALGWYAVEGEGGVGIVSAYPLDAATTTSVASGTVPAVGVTARVPGRAVRLWSVGLDAVGYGPATACQPGASPAAVIAAEKATPRLAQAKLVAAAIADDVAKAAKTPVVMLGDLQSPAAADWTAATANSHCGVGAVDWPVPDQFTDAGLTDSFRANAPDPAADPGTTWSPLVATGPQDRIDYVDFAGAPLTVLGSNTLVAGWPSARNALTQAWTSDHRAVVTTFRLAAAPPPTVTAKSSIAYQVGSAPTDGQLLATAGAASPTSDAVLRVDASAVDFATAGRYPATIVANDPLSGFDSAPLSVTVNVVPVITIALTNPTATFRLTAGQQLTDAQVKAALLPVINVTGTVSSDLSQVDDSTSGSYRVTVTGTDAFGFSASTDATVTLTVQAAPVGGSGTGAASTGGTRDPGSGLAWTGASVLLPAGLAAMLLMLGAIVVIARRAARRH